MSNKRISQSNLLAKEYIVSALLQLIKTKPLSSISVSELCQKAGVSRMTFYRNYESREDIFEKYLDEIFEAYKNDDSTRNLKGIYCDRVHMEHYFDYLYEYREFLDGLIHCGFDVIFLNKLNEYVSDKWKNHDDRFKLAAFSGSLYNMFHLWSVSKYTEDRNVLINTLVELYDRQTPRP